MARNITMQHSKSTARKTVFKAEGEPLDTVYIETSAFKGKPPKTVTVTVKELEPA